MELREKIAKTLEESTNLSWPQVADAILALPELKEALDHVCRDQEILTPEQVRQVGRIYGGEPKTIRVTDD